MGSKDVTIGSWADLQDEIRSIVEEVNADPSLGLAAAANPLFALEELGYEIDPAARRGIEDRLRFGPKGAKRIATLRGQLFEQAGRAFDPIDDGDVRQALEQLGVTRKGKKGASLEDLRGQHPIVDQLLDYRRLESSEPRLAGRDMYTWVREGRQRLPVTRVRAILKQDAEG